jgi:hypothetical protein
MRLLSNEEKFLLGKFADKLDGVEGAQLLSDAERATATTVANGARVMFEIAEYQRPSYRGQHSFGVEATMLDSDNEEMTVLLYADENGRLLELEFVRWDSNDIICPQWNTLKFSW